MKSEKIGLTSYEALGVLHNDMETLLNEYSPKKSSRWKCMKEILAHRNELSTYSWSSAVILVIVGFSLIFTSFFTNVVVYGTLAGHGFFIIAVAVLNILIVSWENQLRHNEIPDQIRNLLRFVKECQAKCEWKPEHYPHLCSPYSPCITLQWTYRDSHLVNVPWALLCRGDTIVLRPGQAAPGTARKQDNHSSFLASGEIYCPPQKYDHITAPTARVPFKNARFILTETPLLRNIREVLDATSTKCSVTSYDKQIYLIMVRTIQHVAFPIIISCSLILGLLRTIYIGQWVGNAHWTITFLLIPSCAAIPILPICFPAAWLALHTFGNAKLSAFLQSTSTVKTADPFEDISIDETNIEDLGANVKWGQHIVHTLLGRQHSLALTRSSNPLHILASVTLTEVAEEKQKSEEKDKMDGQSASRAQSVMSALNCFNNLNM